MNKYQKALNRIKVHVPDYKLINNHIVEVDKHSDLSKLQELVDKETPLKPKKNDITNHDWNSRFCPKCGQSLIFQGVGCINNDCRQKIDWSDEE